MDATYADDEAIGALTRGIVADGTRILQIHRLAQTEQEHAEILLSWLNPPQGAIVIDAGCGIGAVAEAMHNARPDLRFLLVNRSASQLAMCPPAFARINADFHDIPLSNACVDAVMFCYCLGHALVADVLKEAARLLKPGGVVFAYDLVSRDADRELPELGYMAYSPDTILAAAVCAGLKLDRAETPAVTFTWHFDRLGEAKELQHTAPWLARWVKA